MKGHLYQITVAHVEDPKGNPVHKAPLSFAVKNHDDLFDIVAKVKAKHLFEEQEAEAFAIGLKLFREVMLRHRGSEVFAKLNPHFSEFMKEFKQR
ncbi:MAG: DUF3861 domain-containing protein [Pseudomonadales bacterium]|jgi:hypothetical protein|nr:DUF3861 domain-containing protein [Pseudomonadales bacterium]